MKKIIMFSKISVLILLGLGCLWWVFSTRNPYSEKQLKLANDLGVRIEDYPLKSSFPVEYFDTVLQPGATIEKVHSVIKGYEKVLHCDKYSEIYYYYYSDDSVALRFQIVYNDQGILTKLDGEDRDSRTIRTEGCYPGLLVR